MMSLGLAAATGVFLVGLMVADARGNRVGIWVCKPLASLCFTLAAVAHGAWATPFGRYVVVGLALGALGDVLLIPHHKAAFLGGLVSFLLGHVAYAVGFVVRGVDVTAALVGGGVMLVPAFIVGRWLLPKVEAKMKVPVLAYMVVISAMVALGVGTVALRGNAWLLVAAVAFYASDLSVARDRFVSRGFVNRAWGLPLYYGAQVLFALACNAG